LLLDEGLSLAADFIFILGETAVAEVVCNVELAEVTGVGDAFWPVVLVAQVLFDDLPFFTISL
jgi:hypothetical protein